jgi:UDP-N-acetylmuramoylalanine--D-glutamate ligase
VKVLVLGAAVSGIAAARLARRVGHDVEVYDQRARAVARLRGEGFALHSGTWSGRALHDVDLVITSPGIPEHADPITGTLRAGIPLVSEMEFAAGHLEAPYVAVTGTNGKTTVTEAAAAMLAASGLRSCGAGNIGTALSDVVGETWDAVVVEASSFQLRFIDAFHPAAAAITNVAPDHLDWHGTEQAYADAKARIFEHMTAQDVLAFDADDAGAAHLALQSRSRRIRVSGTAVTADGYGVEQGHLVLADLRIPAPEVGAPFLADLALAAAVARSVGATAAGITAAVTNFRPGAHRRSLVAERNGIAYVNDSKATNPHAAAASVQSYPSVVLIAGGRNKGLDLSPLATLPSVRFIVGLGEAADELAVVVPADRFHRAGDMVEAVTVASARARPGDVVLLAPGCASFDMYESYAARGEAFATAVRQLEEVA